MSNEMDRRPMFAYGQAANGDAVITIGLPRKAIEEMLAQPGFAKDMDLSRAGVPLIVSIFAAEDHEACKRIVMDVAEKLDIPHKGFDAKRDFSIKDRRS